MPPTSPAWMRPNPAAARDSGRPPVHPGPYLRPHAQQPKAGALTTSLTSCPRTSSRPTRSPASRRYLDMAKLYLLDSEFFDPLAEGDNILPGKHGYSHAIALSSGREGLRGARRREVSASHPQRLGHDRADPAICLGRVGGQRNIRPSALGRTGGQPDGDPQPFRDAVLFLCACQAGPIPDGALPAMRGTETGWNASSSIRSSARSTRTTTAATSTIPITTRTRTRATTR